MNNGIQIGDKTFSRGEIARGTGLSLSHVSRIFSGERNPSLNTVRKVAQFINIPLEQLILRLPKPPA